MTLNAYREQFRRNTMIMLRTADYAPENTDRALSFLYDNRGRSFKSAKDLEELLLETVTITNKGTAREGCLFREEDREGSGLAQTGDIPAIWDRFLSIFHWMLGSQCFEVEESAAFSEYVINAAQFFPAGCGKIAMLISTFVFMRYGLPCPVYTSEDEYCRIAVREKSLTAGDMNQLLADPGFWDFVSYYLSICPSRDLTYSNYVEKLDDGSYVCHLTGKLTGVRDRIFRQNAMAFYEKYGDVPVVFDCSTLAWIDMEGISVLADLREAGKQFTLRNLNADCMVLFKVEGFDDHMEGADKLPKIDLSGCEKINEGADGIIYRLSDELVAKTFKNEPDYYDIVKRRIAQKNALIAGVPAPFSFGYAEYDGQIATLMELIHSRSLLQVIATEEDIDDYILRYARFVRQLHEIRDEEKLGNFDRNLLGEEILGKADRCDPFLKEKYRGMARKIVEAIDEPECLVHGDIHPNNLMASKEEMLFIDFDSFSTGKGIYDLGTLYRTLLYNGSKDGSDINTFLKIPMNKCRKIWGMFFEEYYKDEQDETVWEKTSEAKLIATVFALASFIKYKEAPEVISEWAAVLEEVLEDW